LAGQPLLRRPGYFPSTKGPAAAGAPRSGAVHAPCIGCSPRTPRDWAPQFGGCNNNPKTIRFVWNCGDQNTTTAAASPPASVGCFASAVKAVMSAAQRLLPDWTLAGRAESQPQGLLDSLLGGPMFSVMSANARAPAPGARRSVPAPLSLARRGQPPGAISALSASPGRRSAQLVLLDVFDLSGQLTDRQYDLVKLLLDGTGSQSAIDVHFYLSA
jgi:hypothetical protein